MSQDSFKLMREMRFIESSFEAGIITKSEYEISKKRVEDKLDIVKKEEAESQEPKQPEKIEAALPEEKEQTEQVVHEEEKISAHEEKPEVSVYYDESHPAKVERKEEELKEKQPVAKEQQPLQEKQRTGRFETYGSRFALPKKSRLLVFLSFLILIFIILFSFNSGNLKDTSFTPVCESDLDCQKTGFTGKCINASTGSAECIFKPAIQTDITIITSEECKLCDIGRMKNTITQIYPGAEYQLIDANDPDAELFISELSIESLPAYIFDKGIEKTERFKSTSTIFTKPTFIGEEEFYLMKPGASGSSYLFKNEQQKNSVELFFTPFAKSSERAFENILELTKDKDINLNIRYYTRQEIGPGNSDVKELLRQVCIRSDSEDKLISYIGCIFKEGMDEETAITCMDSYNIPKQKIEKCIQDDAESILSGDIDKAREFSINTLPVFIFNNQYKKGGSLSVDILEDLFCKINPDSC
ncbi:MAG: hypothetical protein KAK00_04830 [Nanoarchaeota archaeon]|nr:hypothetical protein [Nanoarchaeota archaeon]